jgi:hypothetical protein
VNFDNANRAAAAMGKRLPTADEWAAIAALPHAWDDALKGMWFSATPEDLDSKDPEKCQFLPAAGYEVSGIIYGQGVAGDYWSSTIGDGGASRMSFNSTTINPNDVSNPAYGFSICCVQDSSPKILTADNLKNDASGTWTPDSPDLTAADTAVWQRVGNRVFVQANVTTSAATLTLSGLPFTPKQATPFMASLLLSSGIYGAANGVANANATVSLTLPSASVGAQVQLNFSYEIAV